MGKELFKVGSLNSLSILIKIAIGFITSKLLAVYVGPSGLALVGNFRNFISSVEAFCTLGFENGVIKYVAEHKKNEQKLANTLSTIFIASFLTCLIIGFVLFFGATFFNHLVFNNYDFSFIFKAFALALPFYIANTFIIASLNGFGKFNKVVSLNIIGSLLGLVLSFFLIVNFKTAGSLFAIILTPSLLFIFSFFLINKEIKFFKTVRFEFFSKIKLKKLYSYSVMALVSSVFGPMVFLAIRNVIIHKLGIQDAGYWEAMNRLSSYYFLFITSILGLYYLPKLSEAENNSDTQKLFWSYYKTILPLFLFGLITIFFLKEFIIQTIFTKEFLPLSKLFFWQLVGDFFKSASFILAYQFYAKKLTKPFVFFEISSLVLLYISSLFLLSFFQLEGIVMAYSITYFVYFIALSFYFRKSLI